EDRAAGATAFFETKIRPVLVGRCFKCHGSQKATNGLRVDSREALLKGGKHGPAVVTGDPEQSPLSRAVRYTDERKMPPDKQLSAEVVTDFERWIAQGAFWPEAPAKGTALDAGEHWAFQPIRSVLVPAPASEEGRASGWGAGAIDSFVLAELRRHGLQ